MHPNLHLRNWNNQIFLVWFGFLFEQAQSCFKLNANVGMRTCLQ